MPRPLLLLAFALATARVLAADADWPQFLGPDRNGTTGGPAIVSTFPPGGPRVVWKAKVGQGLAGPVVAGDRLICFHRLGDQETVDCLDALTGQKKWSAAYPSHYRDDFGFDEGPRSTPAIAGDRVYTFGAEGALHCWDLASGKEVWAVDTKADFGQEKGFFGIACSPLVEGDAVILNIGGHGAGVVAFDRASGKVLWRATDDEAGYASPVAATINGARLVLSFTRAGLVGLDPKSGAVAFQMPMRSRSHASVNAASPLLVGTDEIFLSACYETGAALVRIAGNKPGKVWASDQSMSNHYATCVCDGTFLYGFHGRQEQRCDLRCVEAKTGRVRWSEDHFGAGSMLLAGGQLVVLSEKGELILAPATPDGFKPTAKAQLLGFDTRAYPALAGGLFYARGKDTLVCADLRKP